MANFELLNEKLEKLKKEKFAPAEPPPLVLENPEKYNVETVPHPETGAPTQRITLKKQYEADYPINVEGYLNEKKQQKEIPIAKPIIPVKKVDQPSPIASPVAQPEPEVREPSSLNFPDIKMIPNEIKSKTKESGPMGYEEALTEIENAYKDKGMSLADLAVMAVPLVVGGSMGYSNVGAGVGAKYGYDLMKKESDKESARQKALAEIAKKKAEKATEYQMKQKTDLNDVGTYLLDDVPVPLTHSQAIELANYGRKIQSTEKGRFAQTNDGNWIDTYTGKQVLSDKPNKEEIRAKSKLDQMQFYALKGVTPSASELKESRTKAETIGNAYNLFASGNPFSYNVATSAIARALGDEKGPLSDPDIARVAAQYPAMGLEKFREAYTKFMNGKLDANSADYQNMKNILRQGFELKLRDHNNKIKSIENAYSKNTNIKLNLSDYMVSPSLPDRQIPAGRYYKPSDFGQLNLDGSINENSQNIDPDVIAAERARELKGSK